MITDLEKFSSLIKYIKQLFVERKARYFFESGHNIELVLTDQQEINKLIDEVGLKKKELDFALKVEIPAILISAIRGDNSKLEFLINIEDSKENEREKYKQLIQEKLKIVSEILVSEKMKDGYLLKKTSKHNFIGGVDWEINTKIFDDEVGRIPDLKYAVIRFNISSSEKISDFFPFPFSEDVNETVISLDINDIENLIDILTDIKKALGGSKDE